MTIQAILTTEIERGCIHQKTLNSYLLPCFPAGDWVVTDDVLYEYRRAEHRYVPVHKRALAQRMLRHLAEVSEDVFTCVDLRKIRTTINTLLISPDHQRDDIFWELPTNLVNTISGVIDTDTCEDVTSERDFWAFRHCIQGCYLENSDAETLHFDNFCKSSLGGRDYEQNRQLLLEMIGYALSNDHSGKCASFLIGAPDSGKSVILRFLQRLLGETATTEGLISNVSLHALGNRFNLQCLSRAKLNICGEIDSKPIANIQAFKAVTGGDPIISEQKHADPKFMRPSAKLIFAGNTLPPLSDTDPTDAFLNRVVVLVFNLSIPKNKMIFNLEDLLWEERDAIVTQAVDAFASLRKNHYRLTMPALSAEFLSMYKVEMNSFRQFLDEKTEPDDEERIPTKFFFDAYDVYCKENRLPAMPEAHCREVLRNIDYVKIGKMRIKGVSLRGIQGLRMRCETDNRDSHAETLDKYFENDNDARLATWLSAHR